MQDRSHGLVFHTITVSFRPTKTATHDCRSLTSSFLVTGKSIDKWSIVPAKTKRDPMSCVDPVIDLDLKVDNYKCYLVRERLLNKRKTDSVLR